MPGPVWRTAMDTCAGPRWLAQTPQGDTEGVLHRIKCIDDSEIYEHLFQPIWRRPAPPRRPSTNPQ